MGSSIRRAKLRAENLHENNAAAELNPDLEAERADKARQSNSRIHADRGNGASGEGITQSPLLTLTPSPLLAAPLSAS